MNPVSPAFGSGNAPDVSVLIAYCAFCLAENLLIQGVDMSPTR